MSKKQARLPHGCLNWFLGTLDSDHWMPLPRVQKSRGCQPTPDLKITEGRALKYRIVNKTES